LRIDSWYGTRGGCSSTSTPKRRLSRSTPTSTCIWDMPDSSCSPVCSSRRSMSVGSSSASRRSELAIFSSSPFAFGVIAKLMTGSGKPRFGSSTGCSWSSSTSPVCVSFSFATAPRSPSPISFSFVCSLPCITISAPSRSFECVRGFARFASPFTVP
jgi:hypothetical protein